MKLKLKKKTRKRLRRLARRVGHVSGMLASELISEMATSFLERGTDMMESAADQRHRAQRTSNGHRRPELREPETRLPRTADHS